MHSVDQQALEVAGVVVAALSAVATAVSAGVIAVQARHTRASAEASKAAVEVSNETLREAQIARLDALAPHIFVEHQNETFDDAKATNPKNQAKASEDYVFRMPRDAKWNVSLDLPVRVRNEGQRSVQLRFSPGIITDEMPFPRAQTTLRPGQEIVGRYTVSRPLSEWVNIYNERAQNKPGEEHTFEVAYIGSGDSDVFEYHRVNTGGTLVRPVPNQDGAWQLANLFERTFTSEAQPLERIYWKSRKREEKF